MKARVFACGRPVKAPSPPPSPSHMVEWKEKLQNYLKSQKLKFTQQRWAIAREILENTGHLDIQSIVERVKRVDSKIGMATVYRNIKVLCAAGILEVSHQNSEGKILYEIPTKNHHDHIVCKDCGEIFEFQESKIEELQIKVSNQMKFTLASHRHVILGQCQYLKEKKK